MNHSLGVGSIDYSQFGSWFIRLIMVWELVQYMNHSLGVGSIY